MLQNVTSLGDDTELASAPSEIWSICSLEFPVIYEGRKYCLFTQPYYGNPNIDTNFGEGILYPPFFSRKAEVGYFKRKLLGEIRAHLARFEDFMADSSEWAAFAYNLGLGEPQFESLGYTEELKQSPRDHNVSKFFRINRIRAWNTTSVGKCNLADPEFIKGHFFVPLDLQRFDGPHSEHLGPHRYRFWSKPLGTQFDLLRETYLSGKMGTGTIKL